MHIKVIVNGKFATNTYIVGCNQTKQAIIIDPAEDVQRILSHASEYQITHIVNTHGHADHISGNKPLYEKLKCEIAISSEDATMLQDTNDRLAQYLGISGEQPSATVLLEENTILKVGSIEFRVIKTPGHTPGGISLYNESEKVLFSGDTLFRRSIGRVDLPGGNMQEILKSLAKLMKLPNDIIVYPGHGQSTTILKEKETNPYCQQIGEA